LHRDLYGRPLVGKTAGVALIVDDLVAWLVGLVADAGRKKLTALVREVIRSVRCGRRLRPLWRP
jgi:hypothetical protein